MTDLTPKRAPSKKATKSPAARRAAAKRQPRRAEIAASAEVPEPGRPGALRNISEVRHFFRTNDAPIYFVGATPFNLLGLDRWVRRFSYITYYDAWDGAHPHVFTPAVKPYVGFRSSEEINNWLLANPEVQAHIAGTTAPGVRPKVAMVCFDEQTEQICADLGYDLILPPARLRRDLPGKLATAGLGGDLPADGPADHRRFAVEAVLTRKGTVVGPLMSDLTGRPELTPYPDGWCGNEMYSDVLGGELRVQATQLVRRVGEWLGSEGYRGFFELDVLVDDDRGEVYLGQLNPRISGATAITHVTAGAYADVPLFLFHLLEFMEVDFDLDVEEINRRWDELASVDEWSQMLIKETAPTLERIDLAAPTGQYRLDADGTLVFRHAALDWHQLQNESEAFFLRIYGAGDYRWNGADLGVLVTKGRLQAGTGERPDALSPRASHLVSSIRSYYSGTPVAPAS
jgi:hypothetical protein